MGKESTGIKIVIGGCGYSLSRGGGGSGYSLVGSGGGYSLIGVSKGYSLAGSGRGYSLTGSVKGYSLTNRINDSSRIGYSSITPRGYANAAMKMKGYSIKQRLYGPVSLFPVSYGRLPDPLDEARRLYKKKCPSCGSESMRQGGYSFN